MRIFSKIWRKLSNWWSGLWTRPYRSVKIEELPDSLSKNTLYIAGEGPHLWFVAMICPCGCGEVLQMSLLRDARPCWNVSVDSKGVPTLYPSVWRHVGCKSHFFLTNGLIQWC